MTVGVMPDVGIFHFPLVKVYSVKPQDVRERLWDRTDFGEREKLAAFSPGGLGFA